MDLLRQIETGFNAVAVEHTLKTAALAHLQRWITAPDLAAYRPQLEWLIANQQWAGLLDRFFQVLPFGTGGRRGPVGIGPNRMNLWTLGASVQGHCEYLKEKFPGIDPLHVAVAYDVRRFEDVGGNYSRALPNPVLHLTSRHFAEQAASIYVAHGVHVHMLPANAARYVATPELSFAIRRLRCHGGLNVSASHNPPDDNGGKFYDENGAQPVAPDDQIMSDLVEQVDSIKMVPWSEVVRSGKLHALDAPMHQAYIELCRRQNLLEPPKIDELRVVFTPLHGVGAATAFEVLEAAGFGPYTVTEQMEPNGLFPNVKTLPNPEIPEAFALALTLARELNADLALATDPDADRIGAVAADGAGSFRFLTGNDIACLIAYYKLQQLTRQGRLPASPIVITTEVTTRLLTQIARQFGAQVVNYLPVGFKHIAEVLRQLQTNEKFDDITGAPSDFVFGAEEAHGILVTADMRDKDAASAALLLAEAALEQKRIGRSLLDLLDDLQQRFGYYRNEPRNLVMMGVAGRMQMAALMASLRAEPPAIVGKQSVTRVDDLQSAAGRFGPLQGATDAASRNVLLFEFGPHARLAIRPSGTEPKAKIYAEVCGPPKRSHQSDSDWHAQCRVVDAAATQLADAFQSIARERARNTLN